jgi:hypothetical protein
VHLETPVVDRTASMRPRTSDPLSHRSRSHLVARVPRPHTHNSTPVIRTCWAEFTMRDLSFVHPPSRLQRPQR